jgi:hypothetical protein
MIVLPAPGSSASYLHPSVRPRRTTGLDCRHTAIGKSARERLTTAPPATITAMAQLRPPTTGVRIVPANMASWTDLEAILGTVRCHGCLCFCQRYKTDFDGWRNDPDEERAHRLRMQTECGHQDSGRTSGLVAFVDGTQPAGAPSSRGLPTRG